MCDLCKPCPLQSPEQQKIGRQLTFTTNRLRRHRATKRLETLRAVMEARLSQSSPPAASETSQPGRAVGPRMRRLIPPPPAGGIGHGERRWRIRHSRPRCMNWLRFRPRRILFAAFPPRFVIRRWARRSRSLRLGPRPRRREKLAPVAQSRLQEPLLLLRPSHFITGQWQPTRVCGTLNDPSPKTEPVPRGDPSLVARARRRHGSVAASSRTEFPPEDPR